MDLLFACVLIGIVGARLYYVVFSWDMFRDDLWRIFNLRQGGVAIYGGIIFGALAAVLLSKRMKIRLLPALDLMVGGLLLGQAIGRWGNFTNIEAFGSNTTLPWGMTSASIQAYLAKMKPHLASIGTYVDPSVPVHPTFLYESLWCLAGFLLMLWFARRRRFDGELSLFYFAWYGFGRFFIEGLRTDPLLIGTIRISQLVALACVIVSVLLLVIIRSRIRQEGDPDFMTLYVNTQESKMLMMAPAPEKKEKKGAAETVEENESEDIEPATPEPIDEPNEQEARQNQEEDSNGKEN